MNENSTAMEATSKTVEQCQICGSSDLTSELFLGYMPPVNTMRTVGDRPFEQPSYPAELLLCHACELVQLGLVVNPNILFPPEYPYTSGVTRILHENFAGLAREAAELFSLGADDLIVDVGSNDGTLLSKFQAQGHKVQGIEPTGAGKIAIAAGIPTETTFFGAEAAAAVRAKVGPASLVTAANVFAHIDGVHDVVEAILTMLDDRGVFVSESHYLMSFLDTVQYDTVYHEHLRHYSVASLKHLLEGHGLEILHARTIPTHGGSVRVYAAKAGAWPVQASVAEMLASEAARGTITEQLAEFRRKTVLSKLGLHAVLHKIKAEGGKIYGIGAPSRASTLVNYTGLDDNMLDCVLELPGSQKLGKYLPGTLIPVESEARLFDDPPDYALLLSWHIADELMPKLTEKGFKGGYIIPLPDARIVPGA
jgi:hypothetical protein